MIIVIVALRLDADNGTVEDLIFSKSFSPASCIMVYREFNCTLGGLPGLPLQRFARFCQF